MNKNPEKHCPRCQSVLVDQSESSQIPRWWCGVCEKHCSLRPKAAATASASPVALRSDTDEVPLEPVGQHEPGQNGAALPDLKRKKRDTALPSDPEVPQHSPEVLQKTIYEYLLHLGTTVVGLDNTVNDLRAHQLNPPEPEPQPEPEPEPAPVEPPRRERGSALTGVGLLLVLGSMGYLIWLTLQMPASVARAAGEVPNSELTSLLQKVTALEKRLSEKPPVTVSQVTDFLKDDRRLTCAAAVDIFLPKIIEETRKTSDAKLTTLETTVNQLKTLVEMKLTGTTGPQGSPLDRATLDALATLPGKLDATRKDLAGTVEGVYWELTEKVETNAKSLATTSNATAEKVRELQARLERIAAGLRLPKDDDLRSVVFVVEIGKGMLDYDHDRTRAVVVRTLKDAVARSPGRKVALLAAFGPTVVRVLPLNKHTPERVDQATGEGRLVPAETEEVAWEPALLKAQEEITATVGAGKSRIVYITCSQGTGKLNVAPLVKTATEKGIEVTVVQLTLGGDDGPSPVLANLAASTGGDYRVVLGQRGNALLDAASKRIEAALYQALDLPLP